MGEERGMWLIAVIDFLFISKRVRSVIGFKQVWRVDLVSELPRIVAYGVSFPFDEVLEPSRLPMTSVV